MLHQHLSQENENTQASLPVASPIGAQRSQNKVLPPTAEEIQEFQEWLDYLGETAPVRWDSTSRLVATLAFLPMIWEIYIWLQMQALSGNPGMSWFTILRSLYSLATLSVLPLTLLAKIHHVQADTQADLQLGSLDSRWVGPLAEALVAPKPGVRSLAARALARLLPRLRTSEGALLNERQRSQLYFRLRARSTDLALKLAILKAIERLGDVKAIEYVEPLTSGRVWLPGRRRVRKAARACLAALEKHLEPAASALAASSHSEPGLESLTGDGRQRVQPEEQQRKPPQPALRVPFLVAALATILPLSVMEVLFSLSQGKWIHTLLWALPLLFVVQLYRFTLWPSRTEAVHKLAASLDLKKIGELVDALDMPDAAAQEAAKTALTQLLPQMRASDAGRLNAMQRNSLYRRLQMSNAIREAKFLEALLKALEQVGDEMAVPYVERLANGIALTPSQKRVKLAAEACLPYLQARSAQIKASQTLLRASSVDEDRTASLLRPAGEAVVTDPQQLLRAASESDIAPDKA